MSEDRPSWSDAVALNRARWDELAGLHGQDPYYDTDALIAGADTLAPEETEIIRAAIGDVAGRDVLHVQCHIGFDTISLARRGARMTGADFSGAALAKARGLAARCGVEIDWVQADSTALPARLAGSFDLAYASVGVICWIEDMTAWMRSVHATLRPGGRLVLIDFHPLAFMLDSTDPLAFGMPYENKRPFRFSDAGSYAVPDAPTVHAASVEYAHSLGELVSAAADAGFRIDALVERADVSTRYSRGLVEPDPDGRCRLRVGGQELPMLFAIRATRPAVGAPAPMTENQRT
jgi:SAM-dependent methyltransferase